ncbi:Os05g0116750 [Oryza sativa Japonica Group]|uniref:Os05g0116750 protein n=1 Tax=Oryza sativa subsp. japonica TaxID=39947 RepID=A0A0P0WHI6_ORYSJ|nr:hypothetical protein EE612_026695 [Oryza sativa]BAS91979.1 Os05g0116750 [Oryza sativa Japonica Group]
MSLWHRSRAFLGRGTVSSPMSLATIPGEQCVNSTCSGLSFADGVFAGTRFLFAVACTFVESFFPLCDSSGSIVFLALLDPRLNSKVN